ADLRHLTATDDRVGPGDDLRLEIAQLRGPRRAVHRDGENSAPQRADAGVLRDHRADDVSPCPFEAGDRARVADAQLLPDRGERLADRYRRDLLARDLRPRQPAAPAPAPAAAAVVGHLTAPGSRRLGAERPRRDPQ